MSHERDDIMLGTPELRVADVPDDDRARAVRTITGHPGVTTAADAAELLDMLGLDPAEARHRKEPAR